MMDKGAARAFARLQTALGAEPKHHNGLPALALSVRQPFAWAIIHAEPRKDVENRRWERVPKCWRERRGRVAIHAARGMTRREYEDARRFMERLGVDVPPAHELRRGGIIGSVKVASLVEESSSPWFIGPLGLVLAEPRPCQFVPAIGRLGYFRWEPSPADSIPKTARWMFAGRQLDMMEWLDTHQSLPVDGDVSWLG
jgi:hypothetical protein